MRCRGVVVGRLLCCCLLHAPSNRRARAGASPSLRWVRTGYLQGAAGPYPSSGGRGLGGWGPLVRQAAWRGCSRARAVQAYEDMTSTPWQSLGALLGGFTARMDVSAS